MRCGSGDLSLHPPDGDPELRSLFPFCTSEFHAVMLQWHSRWNEMHSHFLQSCQQRLLSQVQQFPVGPYG